MVMTKTQRDVASFLLRFTQDLWQDDDGEPNVEWRGDIRHVQGDEQARFTDFSEAVTFMQRTMKELTVGTLEALSESEGADPETPWRRSLQLWEESAASYANMMFGAVEQTVQQSGTFREQLDAVMRDSMQAWAPSARSESQQILDALQGLQTQVQALADRVGSLEDALKD
jgi:hypothetical protein